MATLAVLACAPIAGAQIYSWRDASGSLVLSDQAPREHVAGVRTFRVPHSSGDFLSTKPAASASSETYDKLITQHAEARGLRPDLVRAVVQVESGYNAQGRLLQGGPRTDAVDAVHRGGPRRPLSVRPGGEHPRRNAVPAAASRSLRRQRGTGARRLQRGADGGRPLRQSRSALRRNAGLRPAGSRRRTSTPTTSSAQAATPAPPPPPVHRICYKITEVVDGQTVVRYTDTPPRSGAYEVIR